MICYFCHQHLDVNEGRCTYCEKTFNIDSVYTIYTDCILEFAHIYIHSQDYQVSQIGGGYGPGLIRPIYFEFGCKYHYRLHLKEDFTILGSVSNSQYREICKLDGFPINLKNARDKLKTLITFS